MNAGGWTMLIVSVSAVLTLVTYCVTKVLSLPPADVEEIEGPLTIDTGDTEDAD